MQIPTQSHADQAATPPVEAISVGVEDAARCCGIGRTAIYQAVASGELHSFKHGQRRLFLVEDLRAWITAKAKEGKQ